MQFDSDFFRGKKVLVMGLGLHGGGLGTVRFLLRHGARVTITDLRPASLLRSSLASISGLGRVTSVLGKHRKKDFLDADYIIKNPGVPPTSRYLLMAKRAGVPVTSDIGIFLRSCPAPVIGVTGTRGKSTTAHLIAAFLKAKGYRVWLGGNIRKSVVDFVGKIAKNDLVVLELSSFQLQDIIAEKLSPHIAGMTNIFPDHLNWHRTFREYLEAKSIIFRFQHKDDILFTQRADPHIRALIKKWKPASHIIYPTLSKDLIPFVDKNLGSHYRKAVALAVAAAKCYEVGGRAIKTVLRNFRGLEGRQEKIARFRGVHFINDTTATIPEAAIAAIRRFRGIADNHRLILIAGGSDKKLDFKEMARVIQKHIDLLILLPGAASVKLKTALSRLSLSSRYQGLASIVEAVSMREAVQKAHRFAGRGDYILLSPGAASFGLFVNEFDRGRKFVEAVMKTIY